MVIGSLAVLAVVILVSRGLPVLPVRHLHPVPLVPLVPLVPPVPLHRVLPRGVVAATNIANMLSSIYGIVIQKQDRTITRWVAAANLV